MPKRRLLVRTLWLAGGALPLSLALLYGCESSTQFDDLCGWVSDPGNCYAVYFGDIQTRCGSASEPRTGVFQKRDPLDTCFLTEGGQITFEPPLSLTVPIEESTEPLKFTLLNADASKCGEITFKAKYDFSISIVGDEVPDGGVPTEDVVEGGTFSMTGGKDSETLAVQCASNPAAFNFDRLQITKCPEYEAILPHAEVDFNPGGVGQTGIIRARIYYPPLEGELKNAAPVPITYFECVIPAAPEPCANGMQDGAETDVDCGGGICTTKCADSQKCVTDNDCISDVCEVVEGLKICIGPE
jgi:hypothetical protein